MASVHLLLYPVDGGVAAERTVTLSAAKADNPTVPFISQRWWLPGRHRPDRRDIKCDDHHRPGRVVRQPQEVGEDRNGRKDDRRYPRPTRAGGQRETDHAEQHPEGDVKPAPDDEVEPVGVLVTHREPFALGDTGDALGELEETDGQHQTGRPERCGGHHALFGRRLLGHDVPPSGGAARTPYLLIVRLSPSGPPRNVGWT